MKAVEQGIYSAKLPNIVPQRQDSRTIKIPVPKYVPIHLYLT
jgi:ribosome recycling factor